METTNLAILLVILFVTPQTKSHKQGWVELCSATAIIHSDRDYNSHDWDALSRQIGHEMGRTIRLTQSERWCTSIQAKRGYINPARNRMKLVAQKYGYILWFPDKTVFDPWHEVKTKKTLNLSSPQSTGS